MTSGEQSSLDFVIFSFCQEHVYIFVEMHVICVQSNEVISLENNKCGKDPSNQCFIKYRNCGYKHRRLP